MIVDAISDLQQIMEEYWNIRHSIFMLRQNNGNLWQSITEVRHADFEEWRSKTSNWTLDIRQRHSLTIVMDQLIWTMKETEMGYEFSGTFEYSPLYRWCKSSPNQKQLLYVFWAKVEELNMAFSRKKSRFMTTNKELLRIKFVIEYQLQKSYNI